MLRLHVDTHVHVKYILKYSKKRGCSQPACIRASALFVQIFDQLIPEPFPAAGGHCEHRHLPPQVGRCRLLQTPFAVFLAAKPARSPDRLARLV